MKLPKYISAFIFIAFMEITNFYGTLAFTAEQACFICNKFCKSVFINEGGTYDGSRENCVCNKHAQFCLQSFQGGLKEAQRMYRFHDVFTSVLTVTQNCDLSCREAGKHFGLYLNNYCFCLEPRMFTYDSKFEGFVLTGNESGPHLNDQDNCSNFCIWRSVKKSLMDECTKFVPYYVANIFRTTANVPKGDWNYPCHCIATDFLVGQYVKVAYKEHFLWC